MFGMLGGVLAPEYDKRVARARNPRRVAHAVADGASIGRGQGGAGRGSVCGIAGGLSRPIGTERYRSGWTRVRDVTMLGTRLAQWLDGRKVVCMAEIR